MSPNQIKIREQPLRSRRVLSKRKKKASGMPKLAPMPSTFSRPKGVSSFRTRNISSSLNRFICLLTAPLSWTGRFTLWLSTFIPQSKRTRWLNQPRDWFAKLGPLAGKFVPKQSRRTLWLSRLTSGLFRTRSSGPTLKEKRNFLRNSKIISNHRHDQ